MSEPRTAAGRAMVDGLRYYAMPLGGEYVPLDEGSARGNILDIEAEARAAALDEARAAVEATLTTIPEHMAAHAAYAEALAAVDALREDAG